MLATDYLRTEETDSFSAVSPDTGRTHSAGLPLDWRPLATGRS